MIHITAIYPQQGCILLISRTIGSLLHRLCAVEFHSGTLIAELEDDRSKLWKLARDTPEARKWLDIPKEDLNS